MAASLTEAIFATADSEHPLVWCLPDGSYQVFSRQQLLHRAQCGAAQLRQRGLEPEQVVGLALPQGPELITLWLGALVLGAVPTLLPPPNNRQAPQLWRQNLDHIVRYSQISALVCADDEVTAFAQVAASTDPPLWPAAALLAEAQPLAPRIGAAEDVVLLQHSSGTTGLQKGVALSNAALLRQIRLYSRAIELDPARDSIASWLPYYHDMGLIACLVLPLVADLPLVFMDNFAWALQPSLFLAAISQHRPTLCWQPNFAFSFLAGRITPEQKAGLDLSSVRLWVNCSEPVRRNSQADFVAAFAGQGVTASAMASCYAMAENTFAATQSKPGIAPTPLPTDVGQGGVALPSGRTIPGTDFAAENIVSSGYPLPEHHIQIRDPQGQPLPDGFSGEIFIQSPCLMEGYFRRPDLSQRALQNSWYATGDKGLLWQGQLYVWGRAKDMLILSGKNIFPEDVEALVGALAPLQAGRCAALGIDDEEAGTQVLVILAELSPNCQLDNRQRRQVIRQAKQAISQGLGVGAREVLLLAPRTLLKSSSGKISRRRCRELYLGELKTTKIKAA